MNHKKLTDEMKDFGPNVVITMCREYQRKMAKEYKEYKKQDIDAWRRGVRRVSYVKTTI